jgi:putative ABC transport system permease protein
MSINSTGLIISLQIILDAASSLQVMKGRTILAFIGILIGTGAVIAMLHIGHDAQVEALRQFETMGVDLVAITPLTNAQGTSVIPFDIIQSLPKRGVGIRIAAPFVLSSATIRAGRNEIFGSVIATTDELFLISKAHLSKGRFTSLLDGFSAFAVLGAELARELALTTGRTVENGDLVTVNGQVITVVGVLREIPANPTLSLDVDHSIIIPFNAARRLIKNPQITNVAARLAPGTDDEWAAKALNRYFRQTVPAPGVQIQTARQMIVGVEKQMRVYSLLLLAIGSVSLMVGGVGVMNVMLMSVIERRQEIGLRMAIGARRRDIQAMFLAESLVLSGFGGIAGTFIGPF